MSDPTTLGAFPGGFALDKPTGWHTVAGRGTPAIEAWLEEHHPEQAHIPEAGLVHRLDRGTSGCLLVATTLDASEALQQGMRDGSIHKRYVALVKGRVRTGGWFDRYYTSRYKRSKKVTVSESGIKKHKGSCTYSVLDGNKSRTLLEVKLIGPGRRHQVRAGLACLGFPIVGDALYGGPEANRLMLHASVLKSSDFAFEVPAPFDLEAT